MAIPEKLMGRTPRPRPLAPVPVEKAAAGKFARELPVVTIASRLRFLIDLSNRPAFVGHAMLAEIIGDYRRALKRETDQQEEA